MHVRTPYVARLFVLLGLILRTYMRSVSLLIKSVAHIGIPSLRVLAIVCLGEEEEKTKRPAHITLKNCKSRGVYKRISLTKVNSQQIEAGRNKIE
jgi:hypothetical protein